MKNINVILIICLSLLFTPMIALAGPDHDHGHSHAPISATEAQTKATQRVKQMVDAGKIDLTWREIKPNNVFQKDYGHGQCNFGTFV